MSDPKSVFCEHIKVGNKPLFEDLDPSKDSSQVETAPAFQCALAPQPCRYATRKQHCPTYQNYLIEQTGSS
ncbi:MAG: hypothetical protein FD167_971 [bacterium]|nr:MAG: hypothetical protein FD167_971 [bacterium]